MIKAESKNTSWTICKNCNGRGKKSKKPRKKTRINYQNALLAFNKNKTEETPPIRPKGHQYSCLECSGSGLTQSETHPVADEKNYPHVAIIGGGIGGAALAVACLHRKIPFTLYERDSNFDTRSQGYGLTLQQASKAIEGLGVFSLDEGIVSTRHVVHTTEGEIIGEWGMRKWVDLDAKPSKKRSNIHISRQALRLTLLEQLDKHNAVQWGHQLVEFKICETEGVSMGFQVENDIIKVKADLIVGADGIRSTVRRLLFSEHVNPLRYLGCIVILGICKLEAVSNLDNPLLDSATVFQTVNGNERIYMMPFNSTSVMWQLSFPMPEEDAKLLSAQGATALKKEACLRAQWHEPIPEILEATPETLVSGYPVYDRELLALELLKKIGPITLLGDAAHPMSPFKGQGANQALLDALALARKIHTEYNPFNERRKTGIRASVLNEFESEMLERSATKVNDSRDAAKFLHSEIVLHNADEPRGRCLKKKDS